MKKIIAILLCCLAIGNLAFAEVKTLSVINHVVSSDFMRDGDYYRPSGRILFYASKREFPVITTLDQFIVSPKNKAEKLTIYLANYEGIVSKNETIIPIGQEYLHITTSWNLENKEPGNYIFIIYADGDLISHYFFKVTN